MPIYQKVMCQINAKKSKSINGFANWIHKRCWKNWKQILLDRFGEYPEEVAHLLTIGQIKMDGDRALLEMIRKQQQTIVFKLSKVGTKTLHG